jgi:hypothetical protein
MSGFSMFRTDDFTCLRHQIPGDCKAVISTLVPLYIDCILTFINYAIYVAQYKRKLKRMAREMKRECIVG